ncbi:hypothetical protein, partial [Staphylococcus ureilyticus]|uniref:hypothetical protein n=1 Tax=Staphylococcus ureilyticus TaxID=94138 RepID=UPI0009273A6A
AVLYIATAVDLLVEYRSFYKSDRLPLNHRWLFLTLSTKNAIAHPYHPYRQFHLANHSIDFDWQN